MKKAQAQVGFRGYGRAALLAAALAAAAAAASAQEGAAATFGERVDVELINVEVWVSDSSGNPVYGLGREDFDVFEDGQPVELSHFTEMRDAAITDPFAATPPIEAPVERPARERPLELSDLLREDSGGPLAEGFLVLYFDELFSGPGGRKQVIDDLETFIQLHRVPAERVLVLSQDDDLRVEANLGSNQVEIEAALDRLRKTSPSGARTWADERNALREIQADWERVTVFGANAPGRDPCDEFIETSFREVQAHVQQSRQRIEQTLEHLTNTGSFLAGLPGPKTLIYVSDGLPVTPGSNLLSFAKYLCPGVQGDRRLDYLDGLAESFRQLTRHANANRVTIYTLQAQGLRQPNSLTTADQRAVRNTIRALSRFDGATRQVHRQGLTFMAHETGGRAVFNSNRFIDDLEQIADDMSSYYSVAYAPPHRGDGLEHRIEVKVSDRPPLSPALHGDVKLSVRHRPGYRDKSLDQRMVERLESTLYLNLMANPLGVTLGAGNVEPGEETSKVPLYVKIPLDKITFLPQQGGDFANLRVQVLARDERNRKTAFKQEAYRLARPSGDAQQASLVIELELKPGIHVIAFGIRDEATQEASFVATGLEILPSAAAPAVAAAGGR
jgi:VWFA-related protein